MKHHNIATILMFSTLVACGDSAGSGAAYGKAQLALGVAAGDDSAQPSRPVVAAEQGGEPLTLTSAQVYVRDIELDLPVGVTCADVADAIGAGVTCSASDDGVNSPGDDNPTPGDDNGGVDDNPTPGDDNGGAGGVDDSPNSAKLRIAGPFVVDLVSRTATPSLAGIQIPALTYRRVDMRIDDGDPDDGLIGAGSALDDRSWVSELAWRRDGQDYTVAMSLKFNEDVRIEPAGGVTLEPGDDLLVLFDATRWLGGLPLARCLDDGSLTAAGGKIVLDDRADCGDVEGVLKDAIKRSGRASRR